MTGRIIYVPPTPTVCETYVGCADKPDASPLRDGTIWQCDSCGAHWVVFSGSHFGESYKGWRKVK